MVATVRQSASAAAEGGLSAGPVYTCTVPSANPAETVARPDRLCALGQISVTICGCSGETTGLASSDDQKPQESSLPLSRSGAAVGRAVAETSAAGATLARRSPRT